MIMQQRISTSCRNVSKLQTCNAGKKLASVRRTVAPRCASTVSDHSSGQSTQEHRERLPLLSRVSACVEVNDLVATYETFAGRSAMIGFMVAVLAEAVTEQGLFDSFTYTDIAQYSTLTLVCVCLSASFAYLTKESFGNKFKEAVISSLTAVRRSASSVSQRRVDKAVDSLFEDAFALGTLYNVLDEDLL